MKLTIEDQKIIAAGASFIEERINGNVDAGICPNNSNILENELLLRWKNLTSSGEDSKGFERRIRLSKKSLNDCASLLNDVRWNDETELPDWINTLEKFFSLLPADYEKIIDALPAEILKSDNIEPYQHVWAPWLFVCYDFFKEECVNHSRYLSESAAGSWLLYILNSLNKNFSLCLNSAFDIDRFSNFMFFSITSATSFPKGSRVRYDEFCKKMLSGGWLDFFKSYPVAARLISNFCRQQAFYFAETIKNLGNDIDRISSKFNGGIYPGIIKNIKAGLSDPHNGGKSVIKFEFENGLDIFYKPRSGDVDTLWTNLLDWLTKKMPGIKFKKPIHIEGNNCTWVENIPNSSLAQKEDGALFYYKAGAMLSLIYVLGGTDFHQENLIASGDTPVLIDLETILNPLVRPFTYTEMSAGDKEAYLSLEGDSVLRTCMLPLWVPISKDISRDYGALTPDDNESYSVREWLDINTDRMRRGLVDRKTNPSPNIAHFNGELTNVIDYKDDILKGFEDVYKLIINSSNEFLSENGPLKKLRKAFMRYLPRQSQVYGDMIDRLRSPGLMRNGAAFSIEAEGLAKPFLNNVPEERIEKLWKVYDAERRSILFLNIPLFEFISDKYSIFDEAGLILEDYFLKTAIEKVEMHIQKLSAADLEFQSNMIDASLLCRYPNESNKNSAIKISNTEEAIKMPVISEKEYAETARLIADKIARKVIFRNEKPQWLTLKTDPIKHYNFIGPVDMTLYEGSPGIGLFLAAYEKITGDKTYHELALKCFVDIKEILNNANAAAMASKSSSGYAGGIPGVLLALYNSGKYLDNEELIETAKKGIALLGAAQLENDYALDVIGGTAGGALTIMALYDLLHDERLLKLTHDYADSLINKRFQYEKWKLWPSAHAYKPLTGLAHGASGYALTLAMAYERTKTELFKEAALEAINYETSTYMPDYKNWPDYRHNRDLKPGETAFMAGWCSGAPGIGLARIKIAKIINNEQITKDIENSISFVKYLKPAYNMRDHLCCGYAGRVDFLIEAGRELNRPELMNEAKKQFSFIINRAKKNGSYTFSVDESKSIFTPGLFTGLAGIGYTALRMINNENIPTVLIP